MSGGISVPNFKFLYIENNKWKKLINNKYPKINQ